MDEVTETNNFMFYQGNDGAIRVQIIIGDETVWTSQSGMAEIFNTSKQGISYHLSNIFKEGELDENSVVKEILTTAADGKNYPTNFYNLDVIIAVGYRVNSYEATQFRIWATKILKEYLIKGFALDDERLKQGKELFGKDYFSELVERIREIRASERRFYQKITDIYAQCSIDYNVKSPITQTFFATVQNKLEFAITRHTSAEIIKLRADSTKPNMGLTSWKNESKGGKILKSDVSVGKNYLKEPEIKELNRIVNMYLDYAENMAERNKVMKMSDWVTKLNSFLSFNEYNILTDAGKVRKSVADSFAEKEYDKFRVIQDRNYESDFDKIAKSIKETGVLPSKSEPSEEPLSDYNKKLITAIENKTKK